MNFTVDINMDNEVEETTTRKSNTTQIDYDLVDEYRAGVIGEGTEVRVGVVTQIYMLGTQERDERVLDWADQQVRNDHEWRLSIENGEQRDVTARLEKRTYRKQPNYTVLVYEQDPIPQMAIAVDFPECMLNLEQFYRPDEENPVLRPFRDIIGREGFNNMRTNADDRLVNVIARPFNMRHVNVNRGRKIDGKPAPYHAAFAKTGMLYNLARYCNVLDEDGNFHIKDVSKLLGKVCNFEVTSKWEEWTDKRTQEPRRRYSTNIKPSGLLSKRDEAFFKSELEDLIDEKGIGILLLKQGALPTDVVLKTAPKVVWDTLSFAKDYEGSVLHQQRVEFDKTRGVTTPTNMSTKKPIIVDTTVSNLDTPEEKTEVKTEVKETETQPQEKTNIEVDDGGMLKVEEQKEVTKKPIDTSTKTSKGYAEGLDDLMDAFDDDIPF